MKFEGVCIAVKDVKKARAFYESLFGVKVISDYGINIAFDAGFSLQEDFAWLVGMDKKEVKTKENNFELYFESANFDAFIEKLYERDDIVFLHDVKEARWGQRSVLFYDLDEHLIEVGESMKVVVERFLKEGYSREGVAERMDMSIAEVDRLLMRDEDVYA